eukprot:3149247-Prymnesium_polylepis.1
MAEDAEDAQKALQVERREKLRRMQLEMQNDKYTEAVTAAVPGGGGAAAAGAVGAAMTAAATAEEEVDPLDAFMAEH